MQSTFHMEDKYIRMIRGDTLSFGIELMDENGEPFSQDIDTAFFTCKPNVSSKETLFKKTLSDGISKSDTGKYIVRVSPDDTRQAKAGKYFYDLEIGVNGDIFTIMHGVLELEHDVTF